MAYPLHVFCLLSLAWAVRTRSRACGLEVHHPSWVQRPWRSPAAAWCTSRAAGKREVRGAVPALTNFPASPASPPQTNLRLVHLVRQLKAEAPGRMLYFTQLGRVEGRKQARITRTEPRDQHPPGPT